MYKFCDIRHVHLEISTLCNAECPWCLRNFWGYPYNSGYPEINLTLEQTKKIFSPEFLNQLTQINISGNFGDLIMNPDTLEIVSYFKSTNPDLSIELSTNAGARPASFWERLAKLGSHIHFAIDGLEDTHRLYRQNTLWSTVIKNANVFIQAGGHAIWQMIEFDHNRHQIELCRQMSQDLGFKQFRLIQGERTTGPVFDKRGKCTHVLGNYSGPREFPVLFHKKTTDTILLEDILPGKQPLPINCIAKNANSIYISANGEVSPCCWTGIYPQTYGQGQYHQATNAQLKSIIQKNNALEYPLEECIKWHAEIEKSWSLTTFEQGRLVVCNDACGQKE